GEVIEGDDAGGNVLGSGVTADTAETHGLRETRVRVHAVERRRAPTGVEIIRVRARAEAVRRPGGANVHETAGIKDARRRLEQDRVDDREDRCRRADADRK